MKQLLSGLIVLALFFTLTSCDRDDDDSPTGQDYYFNVALNYDGEALQTNKKYPYRTDEEIMFTRVKLLISDLTLSKFERDVVHSPISELTVNKSVGTRDFIHIPIGDFNFEADFAEKEAAEKGITIDMGTIEPGQYRLSLGIGVSENLNAKEPSDFSVDHPLGQGSEYWGHWSSFIFTKHEGFHYDSEDNMTNFVYHTGSNDCYVTLEQDIVLNATDNEVFLNVDFSKVFMEDDGNLKDIPAEPILHRLSQTDLAIFFCDNIGSASSLGVR